MRGGAAGWHLLIWPWARKSAMSALQVGHGFMTLRSRMVRPVATGLSSPASLACTALQAVSLVMPEAAFSCSLYG